MGGQREGIGLGHWQFSLTEIKPYYNSLIC